jgi:hypothetical protein
VWSVELSRSDDLVDESVDGLLMHDIRTPTEKISILAQQRNHQHINPIINTSGHQRIT